METDNSNLYATPDGKLSRAILQTRYERNMRSAIFYLVFFLMTGFRLFIYISLDQMKNLLVTIPLEVGIHITNLKVPDIPLPIRFDLIAPLSMSLWARDKRFHAHEAWVVAAVSWGVWALVFHWRIVTFALWNIGTCCYYFDLPVAGSVVDALAMVVQ